MSGLMKFDLSSIPASAMITSAKLYFTVTGELGKYTRMMRLYRLKQNWIDNSGRLGVSMPLGIIGTRRATGAGDYDSTDAGNVSVLVSAAPGAVIEVNLNTTELKKLVDGTYANYGWLLKMDGEFDDMHSYASSDSTTAASRPKLYIEYSTTTEIDPWTDKTYSYSQDKPHAVTELKHLGSTAASYIYDANGNMTCRVENNQTFLQYYNAENRMSEYRR